MSEELFNQDQFASDLKERLAQPLPELEREGLYVNLIKVEGALQRILRQSDGVVAETKADGTRLTPSDRALLISQRDGLKETINSMLGKVQKATKAMFAPPFNLDKTNNKPITSTDAEERFAGVEHTDLTTDDFTNWQKIIEEAKSVVLDVNALKNSFEKYTHTFTVPDAINPYREAVLASGIQGVEAAERADVEVNLAQILIENQQYYRDIGLPAWAENIATFDLNALTSEKIEVIKQEIAAGAILIFMPDKATQLATTVEQIKQAFKPVFIRNGSEQPVGEEFLNGEGYIAALIEHQSPVLVEGLPDKPYISLMRPTQEPEERTRGKNQEQQLVEFFRINQEREQSQQPPIFVINPFGYAALQTIYTRQVKKELYLIGQPQTINPLDSATWTYFINLPVSDRGFVLCVGFRGALRWGGMDPGSTYHDTGFRFEVRVEA